MRAASAASVGLPRSWPPTTTTVSAPSTKSCGRRRATASALSRARRSAQCFAASPGSAFSGISAGCTSNEMPALRNNSWRRGDAEASTNMGIILGESRVAVAAAAAELRSAWTIRLRSGQAREAPVPTQKPTAAPDKNQRLLQRLGLDGNVLLASGALFPVFFYPGFVALAGGGVASGEGDGGDFGIGDGWALVAGR